MTPLRARWRWVAAASGVLACGDPRHAARDDTDGSASGGSPDTSIGEAASTTTPATTSPSSTAVDETTSDDDASSSQEAGGTSTSSGTGSELGYDDVVLADGPVGYWAMDQAPTSEPDLSGNGHDGSYHAGPVLTDMPNGDMAALFDGATQYLDIDSSPAFSITTTGTLTWEAWIRPDTLQFPGDSDGGYVDWLGKCDQYAPTCEWEARLYDADNPQDRPNRFSAYAFNPDAGLGSGADWQPGDGLIEAGHWYHVVAEYTLLDQPDDCNDTDAYPGAIDIWVNGVRWDHGSHGQTGCMSQYAVVPQANDSAIEVGTMAQDTWFLGAIGKVAIYDALLDDAQITAHYVAMTGAPPTGQCADTCTF